MTLYELISLGISVIALIFAINSNCRSNNLKEKQNNLKEKQLEFDAIAAVLNKEYLGQVKKEEKTKDKANVVAELVKIKESPKKYRFVIKNKGGADASNVMFKIDPNSPDNPLDESDYNRKLPYPILKADQSFNLIAALNTQSARLYYVYLTWQNPDGTEGGNTLHLSI